VAAEQPIVLSRLLIKRDLADLLKADVPSSVLNKLMDDDTVSLADFIPCLLAEWPVVPNSFFANLAVTLGVEYVDHVNETATKTSAIVPYAVLREHQSIITGLTKEALTLATANPLDHSLADLLGRVLKLKVIVKVAPPRLVQKVASRAHEPGHRERALNELRYLLPSQSACRVFYDWQAITVIAVVVISLFFAFLNLPLALVVVFGTINVIYFFSNIGRFYVGYRGLTRNLRTNISLIEQELQSYDSRNLPTYTILIPIYKEAKVLPHIIENVWSLDYPKDKLDVKILMEESDTETIAEARRLGLFGSTPKKVIPAVADATLIKTTPPAISEEVKGKKIIDPEGRVVGQVEAVSPAEHDKLSILTMCSVDGEQFQVPFNFIEDVDESILLRARFDRLMDEYRAQLRIFDSIIVPKADIQTKPRACNYGLLRARGEYVVIFDAEDDPEPDQLKKAAIAFKKVPEDIVCLQSRLNFYNANENILTRWFSLEYGYWYDSYLDGLDQVHAPIPLGGTSNHFVTSELRKIGGWDPYNVTEDADLGVRIARSGKKTAMLSSYTYEEAVSRLPSWVRQRSRWNKGHAQTYMVHMRHPLQTMRDLGLRQWLLFQFTFGGDVGMILANPLLWAISIVALLQPGTFSFLIATQLLAFMSVFNLTAGNFTYILLHTLSAAKRKAYKSLPYALLIPFYWMLISYAGWRGIIQLMTKPFIWEKTEHGLTSVYKKS
jgi:cellulose synthase/poly-beta-1,6-N-acetylglucosamine synthase-like glycosyltransferase